MKATPIVSEDELTPLKPQAEIDECLTCRLPGCVEDGWLGPGYSRASCPREQSKAYAIAVQIVGMLDARLETGYHYRAADGRLLTRLDEVIRALLDGGLKVADRGKVA